MFDTAARARFLTQEGWAIAAPLGQDSSLRRYFRVAKGKAHAVLMEAVPDDSPLAMTGHKMGDFIRIANWLRSVGLSAPEIYAQDLAGGYMILEDFGGLSFKQALDDGQERLYDCAADVLDHLAAQQNLPDLPQYYESHVHARHRYVMDYYARPKNVEEAVTRYLAAWQTIEASLSPCPQGFLHIDFHAENLMVLEGRTGLQKCGLLDFQGAMIGPVPYDLVNLLEDARRDVPDDIRAKILARYDKTFQNWYRVLGTQFHCRVIGQFIKLAEEGKPQYLAHIPRLEEYIKTALRDPLLLPLKTFFEEWGVDFSAPKSLKQIL